MAFGGTEERLVAPLAGGGFTFSPIRQSPVRIQKVNAAIIVAMPEPSPRPRTWLAVLTALIGPLVLAIGFLTVMDWANRPVSVEEYRNNPSAGQQQSDLNSGIVFLHALAQFAFVAAGAWWTRQRPGVLAAFLLIAVPLSGFVFLVSFIGLIAK